MNFWVGLVLVIAALYYLWSNPTLWQGQRKQEKNRQQWREEAVGLSMIAKSRREAIEQRAKGRDLTDLEKIELQGIQDDHSRAIKELNDRWSKYLN